MMQACAPPAVVVSEVELTSAPASVSETELTSASASQVAPAARATESGASVTTSVTSAPNFSSRRAPPDLASEMDAPKNTDGRAPFRPSSDRRASTFGLWK